MADADLIKAKAERLRLVEKQERLIARVKKEIDEISEVQFARGPGRDDDLDMGKNPAPFTPSLCLCYIVLFFDASCRSELTGI